MDARLPCVSSRRHYFLKLFWLPATVSESQPVACRYDLLCQEPPFDSGASETEAGNKKIMEAVTSYVKSKTLRWMNGEVPVECSAPAKTFVQALLAPDPIDRPSLAELKSHPWFATSLAASIPPLDFGHLQASTARQCRC